MECAVRCGMIDKTQASSCLRHIIHCCKASGLLLNFQRFQHQCGVAPYGKSVLEVCPPEVGLQCSAFTQQVVPVNLITREEAGLAVERDAEAVAGKSDKIFLYLVCDFYLVLHNRFPLLYGLPGLHLHLRFCHGLSCCHQWLGILQFDVYIQQDFTVVFLSCDRQGVFGSLLRCNVQLVNRTALDGFPFINETPLHAVITEVAEEVFVVDAYLSLSEVDR